MERKKPKISEKARAALDRVNKISKETGINNPTYRAIMSNQVDLDEVPEREQGKGQTPLFVQKPHLRQLILDKIREGNFITTVSRYAGISPETFMNWMKKGHSGVDKVYAEFFNEVVQAEAEAEMNRLERMNDFAREDWKANAWLMERRWPDRWGRTQTVQHNMQIEQNTTVNIKNDFANKVIDSVEARELARQLVSQSQDAEFEEIDE